MCREIRIPTTPALFYSTAHDSFIIYMYMGSTSKSDDYIHMDTSVMPLKWHAIESIRDF